MRGAGSLGRVRPPHSMGNVVETVVFDGACASEAGRGGGSPGESESVCRGSSAFRSLRPAPNGDHHLVTSPRPMGA